MRNRIAVALVVCLLFVIAPLIYLRLTSSADVSLNAHGFARIRLGMTQAEVEALLGGVPGMYGRHASKASEMSAEGYDPPPGSTEKIWCDDKSRFEVYFDQTGRVVGSHRRNYYRQWDANPTWLERVRIWLGLG